MDISVTLHIVTLIISVLKGSWCDPRIVTLSSHGKNHSFKIAEHRRKVFYEVPIWTVDSNSKFNYEGIVDTNGIMYEDLSKKAILFKKNNCSSNCWEGVFGLGTRRNVIDDKEKLPSDTLILRKKEGIYKNYPVSERLNIQERKVRVSEIPESIEKQTYYIKLLVVVDYALFLKLGNDLEYAAKYLSIFWSTVDMQYRNITSPRIEVRITGVVIGKDDKSLNYISNNVATDNTVQIDQALFDAKVEEKDFIKNINLTNYDAFFTMTGLNGFIKSGQIIVGSQGISWNASICRDDYHYAVITDDGDFFGIHNAIHEIGHLLGVDHDAVPGNAMFCFSEDYAHKLTVMWPKYEDKEIEYWSSCSLKALQIFVRNVTESWCLRNEVNK